MFGLSGVDMGPREYKYPESCIYMRKYSAQCGASARENLWGTFLRKHIATTFAYLNLTEKETSELTNFLGHSTYTHKNIYR